MRRGPARLRWQLTLSHLIAIAVTLISMIAAVFLIGGTWIAIQTSPSREPANDARIIARAIGPLVEVNTEPSSLNVVLRGLVDGTIRPQIGPGPFAPEPAYRFEGLAPSLRGVGYIVLVGADGRTLASSDPSGAAFEPPERAEWAALVTLVQRGERGTARLTRVRQGPGPVALGASPVSLGPGGSEAVIVVGKSSFAETNLFRAIARGIAIFGAATIFVLGAAFAFAFGSAALVGYLLSRQLVRRLERLSAAVEALAAGQLGRRVEEGPADEVGQLARRFNVMADRLSSTVDALDARTREAEAALAAKRELVASVSHELRTPLASISGHAESLLMLGEGASTERRAESLEVLHREARQLGRLVDDLFLLSTAESGGLSLNIRTVVLADLLEEVGASFRPLARESGRIALVTEVEPGLSPVAGDRERIVQVLSNLVRNALRHTPEGGLVSIRAERQGQFARVTVEDTGAGIPPEQLARIFERFYRGDDARDRASGGAGLGLAIVRELVEAMGGGVSAQSTVGQGSTFAFTLPLVHPFSTRIDEKPDTDLTRS